MASMNSINLTILHTSDIHGHLYPTDYRGPGDKPLGLAKLSRLIQKERSLSTNMLLIDNGDLLQGTPLMYHYAKFNRQGLHPAARALNALGYDAVVLGNHEFNYGQDLLRQAISDSDCPWLSANIVNKADGKPAFGKPYRIFELPQGVRIALLGLTTHFIPNWEEPNHIEGLSFIDALDAAQYWVDKIRYTEQPDAVILSYHGGFERDPITGEATEPLTGENQGYAICETIEGVDILLTGHQHRLLNGEINGVVITQPGSAGQAIAKVELEFQATPEGGWRLSGKSSSLLLVEEGDQADEDFLSLFAEDERQTQHWLDQPIGRTEGDLSIPDPFTARQADHAFTEMINRIQMEVTGAELSLAAIFTNEARGFGELITMRDVVSNYIYPNTLKVVRMRGSDIRDMLEQTARYFEVNETGDGLCIAPSYLEPKPQHFNYDMWEGIDYTLDISKPVGHRVVRLERHGAPLEPEASFDVVMNSYRAGGGGNFDMLKEAPVVREIPTDMTEILADYISRAGVIQATCNHNWKVVY